MKRYLFLSVLGFVLATQYVNCSSYSDAALSANSTTASSTDASDFQRVIVTNEDSYMNCFEDHVEVGGLCNDGDAADNYIHVTLSRDRQTMYWGSGASQTDHLDITKCEDGRFFAIVPKPNDSALADGTTGDLDYQLSLQIYTSTTKPGPGVQQSFKAGESAPIFTFTVQKNANCGS